MPGNSSHSLVPLQMGARPGQRCAQDVTGMLPTLPHACGLVLLGAGSSRLPGKSRQPREAREQRSGVHAPGRRHQDFGWMRERVRHGNKNAPGLEQHRSWVCDGDGWLKNIYLLFHNLRLCGMGRCNVERKGGGRRCVPSLSVHPQPPPQGSATLSRDPMLQLGEVIRQETLSRKADEVEEGAWEGRGCFRPQTFSVQPPPAPRGWEPGEAGWEVGSSAGACRRLGSSDGVAGDFEVIRRRLLSFLGYLSFLLG